MTGRPRSGEQGFSLVEVLIASAIMAAMLATGAAIYQSAARNARQLQAERRALPVAQSVLARVGADLPLVPGVLEGTQNAIDWRLTIGDDESGAAAFGGPRLLDVRVSAGGHRQGDARVELHTLRLAQ